MTTISWRSLFMMNVHAMRLRLHNLNQDMKEVWSKFRADVANEEGDQKHVMTEDEMLDESLKGSFPASDPPGHFSKSSEDKKLHH